LVYKKKNRKILYKPPTDYLDFDSRDTYVLFKHFSLHVTEEQSVLYNKKIQITFPLRTTNKPFIFFITRSLLEKINSVHSGIILPYVLTFVS